MDATLSYSYEHEVTHATILAYFPLGEGIVVHIRRNGCCNSSEDSVFSYVPVARKGCSKTRRG